MGQPLARYFVIAYAKAIAVEIVRDAAPRFTLGPEHPGFGDALANPLDHLTDFAKKDVQGAVQNPEFSLQASSGVEHMRSLPELLQNVQYIQDQSDARAFLRSESARLGHHR